MSDMIDDEDPALWLVQQGEQYHQQQQPQQNFQQGHSQLQASLAFEGNARWSYDGAQMVAPYYSGQPVTTGESVRHSMRPSNREVLNPQYVRPLGIRPSIPSYQPNTSRRANVPFPASFQTPSGTMQASRPMMTQQRTSQSVSESPFSRPSYHTAERSSSTSHYARQERSSATPMQNWLPPLHQQYGGHQNQASPSARPASQVMPGQNNPNISQSNFGSDPSRSPYIAQASMAHAPQAAPSSATPSGGVSLDQISTNDLNKPPFVTHAPSYSQTEPGHGHDKLAPNRRVQHPSMPGITQGQQLSNKMRRLDDGSKHRIGTSSREYVPRAKQVSKSEIQRLDLVRPLDVNDTAVKDSYDVATIARDVLITAGKHPSEEVLNYHLHALMKTIPVVDHSSDLATLRWDGIDPLIYARDKRPRNISTRPPAQSINAIGAVAPPSFHGNLFPLQPPSLSSLSHNSHAAKSDPAVPPPPPIPSPPVPAPEQAPSQTQAATETLTTKLSSTPRSKIPSTSPQAVPHSQSSRAKENSPPQVVISSSLQKMPPIKKRAGRPKKDTKSDNVAVTIPSPIEAPIQFPVFKCLWEKCQTELHSLAVLQQHVLKAHIPHNITCGWKECDNSTPMAASAMWEHLRNTHFKDYAWALGDGPAVPSPGEDDQDESPFVPQFDLFDRQARPATVLLPLDDYVVAGYSKSHGIKNSKQRAELFKEAGCRWKEEAGPDVDISDRRLSTPPRLVTSRLTEIAMTLSESP